MKLICEKDKILKALNSVTKAVAVRTTMPILEGILIQTNDNEIKLTTYDLEIGIEYIINDCKVEEQGATVVNAIMFTEIIRRLPDTDISIEVNDKNLLVIECEGSLYKLATMNPDEFPELPKISVENSIEIEQTILKDMIRKTIFAVSTEENRPIFTGCLFEIANNKLNVVAVDGFRLAWKSKFLQNKVNNFSAVIPGRTLNEINKILIDSFDMIKIGVAKNQVLFEMENCKIVTRLLDGEFLNYSSVIPETWETRVRVNKSILQDCFERVSLISASSIEKEKKYPVKVTVDIGKVIEGKIKLMNSKENLKIPHIGWNRLEFNRENKILNNINKESFVYYVHSFMATEMIDENLIAYSKYGDINIPGIVNKGNVYGMQFHPEKSGEVGLKILKNFGVLSK